MCLVVDREETKKYDGVEGKVYTFYKAFMKGYSCVVTPCMYVPIRARKVLANGVLCYDKHKHAMFINAGAIHAFTTKRYADDFCDEWNLANTHRHVVVLIKVRSEDIIAAGTDHDICFFKYEIAARDWNKLHKDLGITKKD